MTMGKPTPGEWKLEGPDKNGDFDIFPTNERLVIGVVIQNGFRSQEETAANAALLHAAPKLLYALEHCMTLIALQNGKVPPGSPVGRILGRANAAVVAASGGKADGN